MVTQGIRPSSILGRICLLAVPDASHSLRRSMESEGQTERGALAFPKAACRRILGSDDPSLQAMLALSNQWPMVLDLMSNGFKKYDVVAED